MVHSRCYYDFYIWQNSFHLVSVYIISQCMHWLGIMSYRIEIAVSKFESKMYIHSNSMLRAVFVHWSNELFHGVGRLRNVTILDGDTPSQKSHITSQRVQLQRYVVQTVGQIRKWLIYYHRAGLSRKMGRVSASSLEWPSDPYFLCLASHRAVRISQWPPCMTCVLWERDWWGPQPPGTLP